MGRLQRKKPAGKKKKKQAKAVENGSGSSAISRSDASKIRKKPTQPQSKTTGTANVTPGYWGKSMQFLREVRIELKKVTWPSRAQTMGSTAVVIILVMIISIFLGLVDLGLQNLVRIILN